MSRSTVFMVALLVTFAVTAVANAQSPPLSDLAGREPVAPDVQPHYRDSLVATPSSAGTTLSLVLGSVQRPTRSDITASAWLSLPWPRWLGAGTATAGPVQASEHTASPFRLSGLRQPARRAHVALPSLSQRDVRAAVAASRRHAHETAALDALDGMVSRARWSALLPEMRVRATRLVDESASLSPTSYDAERTTSSGKVSLWLEARASWRLDRALFADEELRAAQQRRQLDKARRQLAIHTSQLLFGWLRAVYAARDPLSEPERCLDAWFAEQQAAAELDVLTAGWHKRWLKRRAKLALPWCASELFERVEDGPLAPAQSEEAPAGREASGEQPAGPRRPPLVALRRHR